MEFMPFAEINDGSFKMLFPENVEEYELARDDDGNEWIYCRGVWYICAGDQGNEYQGNEYQGNENHVTLEDWVEAWSASERVRIREACKSSLFLTNQEPFAEIEAWWRENTEYNAIMEEQLALQAEERLGMPIRPEDSDDEDDDYNLEDVD
jgi:hypothetical protein